MEWVIVIQIRRVHNDLGGRNHLLLPLDGVLLLAHRIDSEVAFMSGVFLRWTLFTAVACLALIPSQAVEGGELLKRLFRRKCRQVCVVPESPSCEPVAGNASDPQTQDNIGILGLFANVKVCPIKVEVQIWHGNTCIMSVFSARKCPEPAFFAIPMPCEVKVAACYESECRYMGQEMSRIVVKPPLGPEGIHFDQVLAKGISKYDSTQIKTKKMALGATVVEEGLYEVVIDGEVKWIYAFDIVTSEGVETGVGVEVEQADPTATGLEQVEDASFGYGRLLFSASKNRNYIVYLAK